MYEQNIAIMHQAISHYFQQNTVIVKHFIDALRFRLNLQYQYMY